MDVEDSWQQHAADTLKEGYLLGDPRVVQTTVQGAELGIRDLERFGMQFDRESDGRISQRYFGAHKYRRTAFVGDYTGLEMQRALVARAARLNVPIVSTGYITRILVEDGAVFGAYGFDLVDGSRYLIHADAVILAAGGHTRIWRRTSSRRDENTGDAMRLAVEAGARLRDAELVQFHPSGLIAPENTAGTLVSEAARGEGGRLLNKLGERFMARYDPERMELSTRDRVALACYTEIQAGRGTPAGGVWLDLSHLPREVVMTRLPRVYQTLLELQMLDVTQDPIEVAPTAHYSMGGVWVRHDDHGTDVDGLYAIGEAATGLHGANRLGGNSLIELMVYGRIVGRATADYSGQLAAQRRSADAVAHARAEVDTLLDADGPENVRALQRAVRNVMTEHAGVVRSEAGLLAGLAELSDIEARMEAIGVHPDIAGFADLGHAFDLKSAVLAARATLDCALERRETRGCHNRSDYPSVNPDLQVNLVWAPDTGVTREPVAPIPEEIADRMEEVSTLGKLVE